MLTAHHAYAGFPYLLRLNGQVVAGFRQGDLLLTQGSLRQSSWQAILQDGMTYDRLLLRWATNWRMGAWWLRYALFWLRPKRDLTLEFNEDGMLAAHAYPLSSCRVIAIHLGEMSPDGAFPIRQMVLVYAPQVDALKAVHPVGLEQRLSVSLAAGHAGDGGGAAMLHGD